MVAAVLVSKAGRSFSAAYRIAKIGQRKLKVGARSP
jgi:hypothetical protein